MISQQPHTPGPWDIANKDELGCHTIIAEALGDDAEICYTVGLADDEEEWANSYLIAMSPDLLAVCEDALSVLTDLLYGQDREVSPSGFDTIENLKAIIAQAKGRSRSTINDKLQEKGGQEPWTYFYEKYRAWHLTKKGEREIKMRVVVEYGNRFGDTIYLQPSWGVNIWGHSESIGTYCSLGWPCGSYREAREAARTFFNSLSEEYVVILDVSTEA